jgi:cobalamin biosynthesis protein CobT
MRNWTDWRVFRFKPFEDEQVAKELATMVKSSIKELDAIAVAASSPEKENSGPASARPITPKQELLAIRASEQIRKSDLPQDPIYEIAEAKPSGEASGKIITIARPYYAYTKAFDEVIDAAKLADDSELLRLYNFVASLSADLKNLHGATLASKLGLYKRVSAEHPLAVSILIDNSGSMRGTPIMQTAAWCLLIHGGDGPIRYSHRDLGIYYSRLEGRPIQRGLAR